MFTNVNVDCCKTPGCKNLGLLNSQDYIAQGKNILCRECGYFFPVISERHLIFIVIVLIIHGEGWFHNVQLAEAHL